MESTQVRHHDAWNKGKLVGQKAPFKLKEIWSIRVRLEMQGRLRELAMFDLGIDSKLRACDLLSLRVRDVCHGDGVAARTIVLQQKTQRPVQFEITPPTREVVTATRCSARDCQWASMPRPWKAGPAPALLQRCGFDGGEKR